MKTVKIKSKEEEMVKIGVRIPLWLKKAVEDTAVNERRSLNDQAIVLLEKGLTQIAGQEPNGNPAA